MFSSMAGRSVVVTGGSRASAGHRPGFRRGRRPCSITGRDETALGEATDDLESAGEVSAIAADV